MQSGVAGNAVGLGLELEPPESTVELTVCQETTKFSNSQYDELVHSSFCSRSNDRGKPERTLGGVKIIHDTVPVPAFQ